MSLPLDEVLATEAALYRDDVYNASREARGDVRALASEEQIRAYAERSRVQNEPRGENNEWRYARRAELQRRGDRRKLERVQELQRKARADYAAAREEAQRQAFTYTNDPNLSEVENQKRREEAMAAHMSSPMRIAEAQRKIQHTQLGMFANNPTQNAFEAEAHRQVEAERPWLFEHLKSRSQGGSAARATSVSDLATELLERHPVHTSKRTAAAMTFDRATRRYVPRACTAEEKALARDLLAAYAARGARISGLESQTDEQRAECLARAVSSMGDKGALFLARCMHAAGIR